MPLHARWQQGAVHANGRVGNGEYHTQQGHPSQNGMNVIERICHGDFFSKLTTFKLCAGFEDKFWNPHVLAHLCVMNRVLYNVTCSVDPDIHEEWLDWMMFSHIPDVMKTGFFIDNRICRIPEYEENGVTYAIQYTCKNRQELERYFKQDAPRLQQDHASKYGTRVSAFRTVLEILHEYQAPFNEPNRN
jgi:Domain of unknown function (DUF4286)